jgi:hypothetical protein
MDPIGAAGVQQGRGEPVDAELEIVLSYLFNRVGVVMSPKFLASGDDCYDAAFRVLSAPEPVFMSRIGGSDTNALISYLHEKEWPADLRQPNLDRHQYMVKRFNGYYDKNSSEAMYFDYCETLYAAYKSAPQLVFCNYQLLSIYFRNFLDPSFYKDEFENRAGFVSLVEEIIRAVLLRVESRF